MKTRQGWRGRNPASPARSTAAPRSSTGIRDPFRVLSLPYDADADAVRQAFRRLARLTHPDRGGAAGAFHEVRVAYGALAENLEGERRRWRTVEAPPARSRYAAGLDPRTYPTCGVRISRSRDGRRIVTYDVASRPAAWWPPPVPPPGGVFRLRAAATETTPAFGVWEVPLDAHCVRYVFGPAAG